MVKIKWTCKEVREVPGLGVFEPDQVKPVPKEIAEKLIAQGLAEPAGKGKDGDK